jgi:RNA polymerase sigma-70 factor, ECF subfamily
MVSLFFPCFCLALAGWAALALTWAHRATPETGPADAWPAMLASRLDGEDNKGRAPRRAARRAPPPRDVMAYLSDPSTRERVHDWLRRLCIPSRHLDDLTSDVLADGIESAHTFNSDIARPERWLNGITVHVAATFRKKAADHPEKLVPRPPARQDPAPTPEMVLECEQARMELLATLRELPPGQAAIIVAHDINEMPMKEAARLQGIPASTAYKWRTKALATLATLLCPARSP